MAAELRPGDLLAAFVIAFGSIGVAFALGVGVGTARAVQRGWEGLFGGKAKEK